MICDGIISGAHRIIQQWWLIAVVFLIWGAASLFAWIPRDIFPDFQSLVSVAVDLSTGNGGVLGSLAENTATSIVRFAMGYALSVAVGLALRIADGNERDSRGAIIARSSIPVSNSRSGLDATCNHVVWTWRKSSRRSDLPQCRVAGPLRGL